MRSRQASDGGRARPGRSKNDCQLAGGPLPLLLLPASPLPLLLLSGGSLALATPLLVLRPRCQDAAMLLLGLLPLLLALVPTGWAALGAGEA